MHKKIAIIAEKIIVPLAALAGFFMIFRTGHFLKIADLLLAILGIIVILDANARQSLKIIWPRLRTYAAIFLLIIFFIIIGQFVSYLRDENAILNSDTIMNYGRVFFNIYVFSLLAFVIYYKKNLLPVLSAAIIISPIAALPALWNPVEGINTNGHRLMGTMQNPIPFGFWMAIIFLIGAGIFLSTRKKWLKIILAVWLVVIADFIIWTGSRAAWLALATAFVLLLAFYLFEERKLRKAAILLLFFLIEFSLGAFMFKFQLQLSGNSNLGSYTLKRALNITTSIITIHPQEAAEQVQTTIWPITSRFVIKHPLGFGFGDYARRQLNPVTNETATADSFLELALYGGIGAVVCFLALFWFLGKEVWLAAKKFAGKFDFYDLRLTWLFVPAAVAANIIFNDSFLLRLVWFALGVSLGVLLESYFPYEKQASHHIEIP